MSKMPIDSYFIPQLKKTKTEPLPRNDTGNPWTNAYGKQFLEMHLPERRKLYLCKGSYVTVANIPMWRAAHFARRINIEELERNRGSTSHFSPCVDINTKVSLMQGDITKLEIDAIVNAANTSLLGGGGVDGCIHRGAGPTLKKECAMLNGCHTGEAKITSGHRLPAKYVIHTVGPMGKQAAQLYRCYENVLNLVLEYDIKTIAFCCISTGVFGYPNKEAAHVALNCTRSWLERYHEKIERIIFCTYTSKDYDIYEDLMASAYFPNPSKDTSTRYPRESRRCPDENSEKVPTEISDDEEPGVKYRK